MMLIVNQSYAKNKYPIDSFPEAISQDCRNGVAKVYDECSDQGILLAKALIKANSTGKSVLVVYGAEWCIWCHVFDKYIKGGSRLFFMNWKDRDDEDSYWMMQEQENKNAEIEAANLNKFVSENFIVAHIEGYYSPNGVDVIEQTGFDVSKLKVLPYLIALNSEGEYAGDMLPYNAIKDLEIREDSGEEYRGFDRKILLSELSKLRNLSLKKEHD